MGFRKKVSLSLLAWLAALLLVVNFGQTGQAQAAGGANPNWPYLQVWERTDYPVGIGAASRSWYWGPAPFAFFNENYVEGSGGSRSVAYFDKSRMEITNPDGNPNDKFYVTNGLLVREMISGQLQLGNAKFQDKAAAQVPVSGDSAATNAVSPTYADFGKLQGPVSRSTAPVSNVLYRYGVTDSDSNLARRYPETAPVYFADKTGHNIPGVMWDFMNLQGLVSKDRALVNDKIEDWLYAFGYPITDGYWTRSVVAGKEVDVLVQLYERRVLTYTPSNPAGFKVEMGNVGRHYYQWRYNTTEYSQGAAAASTQPALRLAIPAIGVNSLIQYVGIKPNSPERAMQVPSGPTEVAWYRYGADIGGVGNAVLAGHYDYHDYGPAVFWNLGKLKVGDLLTVTSATGTKFTFRVTGSSSYPDKDFPIETVFGSTSSRNLNLITCEGSFDPASASYNRRLVVYTTLVS